MKACNIFNTVACTIHIAKYYAYMRHNRKKLPIQSLPIVNESTRRYDVNVSIRVCAMYALRWKKVDPMNVRCPIKAHFNILLVSFFPLEMFYQPFSLAISIHSMLSIKSNGRVRLASVHWTHLIRCNNILDTLLLIQYNLFHRKNK